MDRKGSSSLDGSEICGSRTPPKKGIKNTKVPGFKNDDPG